ncbi:RICIN domain-containing protein [Arthrobacter sp.]|uniref:RICIN domain-containing protein n=1 Tax=Arthrobacter sp. TaxID=1667 RepID=UPI00338D8B6C
MYVVTGGGVVTNPSTFALRGQGSGRCLDITSASRVNGALAEIWDCNGGTNQQWTLNGDGTVIGRESGMGLDVTGAGTANGTAVEIWQCTGGSNQKWTRQ